MAFSAGTIAFFAGLFLLAAQGEPPGDVPENLRAPADEQLVLHAHAKGFQMYVCQAATDDKFSWALKAPDAKLFDAHGKTIGQHYAGPAWKHNDGSEVTGKVVARHDAPEAGSIPWLLLAAAGHSGSGLLSEVTSIQRLHTQGGQAPAAGCEESKKGTETKMPYSADYYFYAAAKAQGRN